MGFVDRGGGRESKGSSLRRSSKNPGTAVAKGKSAPKSTAAVALTARVVPALPAVWQPLRDADVRCNTMAAPHPASEHARESKASNETAAMLHDLVSALRTLRHTSSTTGEQTRRVQVDAAVSLLSRSLQDDVQGLLRRACEEGGLRALLCWSRELERQASLLEHCRSHNKLYAQSITAQTAVDAHDKKKTVRFAVEATTATTTTKDKESENGADEGCLLYCLVGIHVGNIVRTHRKIQEQWVGDMAVLARQPEVLGVVSGLNFAREPGTHYAQEWLLKECWRVAAELRLPLVIFVEGEGSTGETAGEGSNNANNNNNNNNDDGAGGEESGASRVAELLQELIAAAQTTTKANEEEDNAEKKDDDGSTRSAASCPTAVVLHNGLRVLAQSAALRGLVQRQRVLATAAAAPHPSSPPFYVLTSAQDVEYVMQRHSDERKRAVGTDMPPLLPSLHYKDNDMDDGAVLSLTQLLLGTNSPWGTPQNIDDAYLRTQRNEPANFPWVLRTLYAAMQQCTSEQRAAARDGPVLDVEDVADVLVCNFLRVFFAHSEATSAPHDEAQGNSAETSATPHLLYRGSALKHVAPGTNADPNETAAAAAAHGEDNARLAKPSVIAHADPIEDVKHAVDSHLHAKEEDAEWRALLAQAAREREAIEAERAAQEAQAALAPKPERHRQKKVNVKANNRSNFTHFRNKDFTPRLTKTAAGAQTQTQQQQQQQQQSASDSDDDETEEDEEATTAAANTMRPKAKPKKKREARALPSHQPQANSTPPSPSSSSSQSDSAEDEAQDEAAMEAAMQPSRSQRRKMQRRRKNKAQ